MTKNPSFHSRTKHIDLCYHFIRSLVTNGMISLKACDTNKQVVDILTKSVSQAKHDYFILRMGVCRFESKGSIEK
ncbi:hypothetical protein Patl1_08297 [Pistacia atlantica]|uniref:Uncharacterized protein n=1 Tax=Pistacia atlantica TaxID=434234 RepID=A0ACC1AFV3_9ROSI|nr:hypothetical protein Patl1_08297 [Pistacia atlantica]